MTAGEAAPPRRPNKNRPVKGRRSEAGSGAVGAWVGFCIFLALLLVAVQVLFNLYATSVVTSVAYDTARRVATAGGTPESMAAEETQARQALGRYSGRVTFDWSASNADEVVLSVHAHNPSLTLPAISGPAAFGDLDRTVRVRVERFR